MPGPWWEQLLDAWPWLVVGWLIRWWVVRLRDVRRWRDERLPGLPCPSAHCPHLVRTEGCTGWQGMDGGGVS